MDRLTPLHLAADVGDAEIVRSLLQRGAYKDAEDPKWCTAL